MMADHFVTHATFTIERIYSTSTPDQVFAAWADPAAKSRWFAGPDAGHELDFQVGGREVNHGRHEDVIMTFESFYRDIVPDARIVFTSTLSSDATLMTVSLTTVELAPAGNGTRLVLTEQDTFLDGHEEPEWRERGTGAWLEALGAELEGMGNN
jgi:uncharacterized protein YndB with AHSA1/START domain